PGHGEIHCRRCCQIHAKFPLQPGIGSSAGECLVLVLKRRRLSQPAKVSICEQSSLRLQSIITPLQWGESMNSPYGLPTECLNCRLRSDSFFCSLSQESLKAFNQIKHSTVSQKLRRFLSKDKRRAESFCFAKGRPSFPPAPRMAKPSSCESPSRETS